MSVLEIRNIEKSFEGNQVLKDISCLLYTSDFSAEKIHSNFIHKNFKEPLHSANDFFTT